MDHISNIKATKEDSNNRVYDDFDPHMEWAREETNFDTLLIYLPGFQKDKLKIQITTGGKLRISGERIVGQNKCRRFLKEFRLEANCDSSKISAKFEGGILYVKVPKSPNNNISNIITNNPTVRDGEKSKPTPKPMSTSTTTPDKQTPASQLDKKPSNAKADSKEMIDKDSKTSTNKPDEKQQKNSSTTTTTTTNNNGKLAAQATSTGVVPDKTMTRLETYKKKFVRSLTSDRVLKSPRALVNIMLAVLFLGVLALYVKNAFKSIVHSNGSDEL